MNTPPEVIPGLGKLKNRVKRIASTVADLPGHIREVRKDLREIRNSLKKIENFLEAFRKALAKNPVSRCLTIAFVASLLAAASASAQLDERLLELAEQLDLAAAVHESPGSSLNAFEEAASEVELAVFGVVGVLMTARCREVDTMAEKVAKLNLINGLLEAVGMAAAIETAYRHDRIVRTAFPSALRRVATSVRAEPANDSVTRGAWV